MYMYVQGFEGVIMDNLKTYAEPLASLEAEKLLFLAAFFIPRVSEQRQKNRIPRPQCSVVPF
jgi:hypothetical protein